MDTLISLKNWPDEAEFTQVLKNILETIGFSNLETTYDLTSYMECDEQLDSWWVKDTEAPENKQNLFYIILTNDLKIHIEVIHPHPALEWVTDQLCGYLAAREDTITGEKYTQRTYRQWCKDNWIGVTTPEAFEQRFEAELDKYDVPSLDFIYLEK